MLKRLTIVLTLLLLLTGDVASQNKSEVQWLFARINTQNGGTANVELRENDAWIRWTNDAIELKRKRAVRSDISPPFYNRASSIRHSTRARNLQND